MIAREEVFQAIFNLLTPLVGGVLTTASRELEHVEDVDATEMPAVYQNQIDERPTASTFDGTAVVEYNLIWYIYVAKNPDENVAGSMALNPVVDAVVDVLPSVGNKFALLVDTVAVNITYGTIQYFEGVLGYKAVAKIPISLRVQV